MVVLRCEAEDSELRRRHSALRHASALYVSPSKRAIVNSRPLIHSLVASLTLSNVIKRQSALLSTHEVVRVIEALNGVRGRLELAVKELVKSFCIKMSLYRRRDCMTLTERVKRIKYFLYFQPMGLNERWDTLRRLGVVVIHTLLDRERFEQPAS